MMMLRAYLPTALREKDKMKNYCINHPESWDRTSG
jgi:hypothetical protein